MLMKSRQEEASVAAKEHAPPSNATDGFVSPNSGASRMEAFSRPPHHSSSLTGFALQLDQSK